MTNCLNRGVQLTKNCRCANLVCLNQGVHPRLMITKCANPACSTVFRYLGGGKLFLFEVPQRQRRCRPLQKSEFRSGEYFWLCEECAKSMTITSGENGHALVTARTKSI